MGGKLLGWRTRCAVEINSYARRVLLARQRDGMLDRFPIWDDVQTFDGKPWRGSIDVITGGFPCQDISAAGRGAGIEGERSGLWSEMARIVGEVRPRYVFVENSPLLVGRGLITVLGDLAKMGYDAKWGIVGAHHVAAPHKRDRIWVLAHSNLSQCERGRVSCGIQEEFTNLGRGSQHGNACRNVANSNGERQLQPEGAEQDKRGWVGNSSKEVADSTSQRQSRQGEPWFQCDPAEKNEGETDRAFAERVGQVWGIESNMDRVAHGVAHRMDRLSCIGNGQVASVAALAWQILRETE